ncbi:hypothetical protein C8J57DRAFT_1236704 [Mycena rebaudengoi]|nr:hypothetical protein C8J57DRAFT_1236704 [Mycena rebaudengoi]
MPLCTPPLYIDTFSIAYATALWLPFASVAKQVQTSFMCIFRINFHYLGDCSGSRNCDDEIGCPPSDDGSRKKLKSLSTFERAAAPENPPRRSARGHKQSTSKPQLRKEGRTVKGMKEWAMVSDSSESNEAYF